MSKWRRKDELSKRRRKGKTKTKTVRAPKTKKKKFSFNRWFKQKFTKKMVASKPEPVQTKHFAQSKPAVKSLLKKSAVSVAVLFKNKIKKSKINVKDIELIEGLDARDLKRRFSVTGSKAKILEGMVADYRKGRLSLPGMSHKSKFDSKSLDKTRLNRMIKEYDEEKRKRDFEEAQKNAKELKKKFSLTGSEGKKIDEVLNELNKGKGSKMELARTLLDPKKLTKDRVQRLIKQYEEAQRKNRGLSYLITQSKLTFIVSKRKISSLLEDVKGMGLSKMFKY